MIQTIVTHPCPQCGSQNIVRNGHDYKGDQKYHCHDCQSYGTLHAQRGYDERTRYAGSYIKGSEGHEGGEVDVPAVAMTTIGR